MSDLTYEELPPAPEAAATVRAVWMLRGIWEPGAVQPIVSDGCAELIFNVGDEVGQRAESGALVTQPRAMLVGPTARPVFVRPGRVIEIVGVRLQPWATAVVTRADAAELRDRVMPLEEVSGVMKAFGDDTLGRLTEDSGYVGELSRLSAALARSRQPARSLAPLVGAVRNAEATPSVRQLAVRFGRSVRSVQRGFRHDVGVEPRTLLRLARIQRALRLAAIFPDQPWIRIAASAGYYDQPHFVREFRELVGMLPSEYRPDPASLTTSFVEKA